MSITDELREYANEVIHREDYMAGLAFDLNRIADRNDEVVASEYVRLPRDADGEVIHIGDVMDNTHKRGFAAKTVIGISYHEGGKMCVRVDEDELRWHDPLKLHHHHEPTVEDVLREFVDEFNRDDTELCDDEIIERFAGRIKEVMAND